MQCPSCKDTTKSKVLDTWTFREYIARQHRCRACLHHYMSVQVLGFEAAHTHIQVTTAHTLEEIAVEDTPAPTTQADRTAAIEAIAQDKYGRTFNDLYSDEQEKVLMAAAASLDKFG